MASSNNNLELPKPEVVSTDHMREQCSDGAGLMTKEDLDLLGLCTRYIPQKDPVLSHATSNTGTPVIPLVYYCEIPGCEISWLLGKCNMNAAKTHPGHSCMIDQKPVQPTLCVWISGISSRNGQPSMRGGAGIHFGDSTPRNYSSFGYISSPPNASSSPSVTSSHNDSVPLKSRTSAPITSERAELHAAWRALVEAHKIASQRLDCYPDFAPVRIILFTDSEYLVESLCERRATWKWKANEMVFKNKRGQDVKHSKAIIDVLNQVGRLRKRGVEVVWYRVPKEENRSAYDLAVRGLDLAAAAAT